MYKLDFTQNGFSCLGSLDKNIAQRILNKLKWLILNADETRHLPLRANLAGLYKFRIGDWRVIYEIDQSRKILIVHKIGHRKDVYSE